MSPEESIKLERSVMSPEESNEITRKEHYDIKKKLVIEFRLTMQTVAGDNYKQFFRIIIV